MEMKQTIRNNLCKGLRACGIQREKAYQVLNTVEKWYRENGPEWTNSRIKDLRQWYETYLAGAPVPPDWFKHDKKGLPKGIWNYVFKLPKAKALGVLALNTCFYEESLSEKQKEKFLHGVSGNGTQNPALIKSFKWTHQAMLDSYLKLPKRMPEIPFPTLFDMNGSIPVHEGQFSVQTNGNIGKALEALRLSWESIPQVTFDFLVDHDMLSYMPLHVLGNKYSLELGKPHSPIVGKVSVIQQPQLKARVVGNPNRITQVTLEPLKEVWMTTARNLPTDVTFNQESGVAWAKQQLKNHNGVLGSDLTSASDLLDVKLCLELVDEVFGFARIPGYRDYEEYFLEVSKSEWTCKALNRNIHWEQGSVLGTGPSFGLLTLTNNAAALLAWEHATMLGFIEAVPWHDCFRVVGDDIIMRSEIGDIYTQIIEALGGEINHSKTLNSHCVAEFAGRIITADRAYLKAVKYSEPSDNSFMSYIAQLGDQAKHFLRPRQRKVYNLLKEVPGIIVNGPWMQDSYGVKLTDRYQWYLEEVQPALSSVAPDLQLVDYRLELLKARLSLSEVKKTAQIGEEWNSFVNPIYDDGYLPSYVTPTFKKHGDPRLVNDQTFLEAMEKAIGSGHIMPFRDWLELRQKTNLSSPNEDKLGCVPDEELTEEVAVGEIDQNVANDNADTSVEAKLADDTEMYQELTTPYTRDIRSQRDDPFDR
jgi:hypothetical protein